MCKSSKTCRIHVPIFDESAKCSDNISNKRKIYMNHKQELQSTLLIKGFFINVV